MYELNQNLMTLVACSAHHEKGSDDSRNFLRWGEAEGVVQVMETVAVGKEMHEWV